MSSRQIGLGSRVIALIVPLKTSPKHMHISALRAHDQYPENRAKQVIRSIPSARTTRCTATANHSRTLALLRRYRCNATSFALTLSQNVVISMNKDSLTHSKNEEKKGKCGKNEVKVRKKREIRRKKKLRKNKK